MKYLKTSILPAILLGFIGTLLYYSITNKNYGLETIKTDQVAGIIVDNTKDNGKVIQKSFVNSEEDIKQITKDLNNIVKDQRSFTESEEPKDGVSTTITVSYKGDKEKIFNFKNKLIKIKNKYYGFKTKVEDKWFSLEE